ncbi:atrial natriuretic peptide receptor 1-like [Physella acuta]|uniref:atrial natriuretic peptide receptor 1-like n=1 Tax=Physella acuta TaxID=109671 RepID=UPI0027DCD1ED|nr:atrial natriuretic peptide receptor 1-like [Physella acuta]
MVLLNKVPNVTVPEVIKFYSDDNNVILKWVGQFIQHSKSGDLWKTLIGYYMLILSKEQAGAERALGSTFYALGGYNNQQMLAYLERKILGMSYLERCTEFSSSIKLYLSNTFLGKPTDLYLTRMREEILRNSINGSDVTMGSMWFKNMTVYINILKAAQDSLATDVVQGLQREVTSLNSALVESVSVMIVALILFPLVIIAVYRLTHRIQAYAQTLQERTRDLDVERKRSETLLFELLPVSVAQKLLNHEDVPPVSYSAVTIFFSDIVGFTNICSRSTPMQVIDMLNLLYRMFDDILDIYDVYKVETIGDAYMVASGLPQENKERHATEMAEMALDLRDNLSQMTVQHLPGESLRMRIGLNSGPVVAGVVGHKMPRYCLFGDTVNVASRMESTSLPLKIQITDRTRRELERRGGYVITERGKVEIKGKGEMVTYWLDQRLQVSDHVMSDHEGEEDEAGA